MDEYHQRFGRQRTRSSIKGQDFCMGFDTSNDKTKRARMRHHGPLVLKVSAILPDGCHSTLGRGVGGQDMSGGNKNEEDRHIEPIPSRPNPNQQPPTSPDFSDKSSAGNQNLHSTEFTTTTYLDRNSQPNDTCQGSEGIGSWNPGTLKKNLN